MSTAKRAVAPYATRSWTSGDGVMVFEVSGELEFCTAPALRRDLRQSIENRRPLIVLDLSRVTFIDSSGVGALVFGCRYSRANRGALAIAVPSQHVQHVLGVMGLLRVFEVFDTVEQAQAAVTEAADLRSDASRRCSELS